MEGHSPICNVICLTLIGAILGDVPVTKIASVNKYHEYFYDDFIENVDKFWYNRILDVGNISLELVSSCHCYPISIPKNNFDKPNHRLRNSRTYIYFYQTTHKNLI